jgi:preprotein translocase subunit SecY
MVPIFPMNAYDKFLQYLPQVAPPTQKKLDFKTKFIWTIVVLVLYFILKHVPLYGLAQQSFQQFQALSVLLGAEFGSLITLGIGPIVTASIVLQLLQGAGILKFNLQTHDGKARFQGTSKLLAYFFLVFQACIFVFLGGLSPESSLQGTAAFTQLQTLLVVQIVLGGFLIMLLDDLVQKWGLASGISLFIAASVSESLFIQLFSPFANPANPEILVGAIPQLIQAMGGQTELLLPAVVGIGSTLVIFFAVVFFQSMKVEIPLSFGRVGGFGIRWPLSFLYTSVIPVTLMAALLANLQLLSTFLQTKFGWDNLLGLSLPQWFSHPRLLVEIIQAGSFADIGFAPYLHALFYTVLLTGGSVLFSWFWMQTSGMDSQSVSKQIMSSGLRIPGFRADARIIEHILSRYIPQLTIMGGITIGLLSSFADMLGSLVTGTGLLLAIMIVYRLYEDIAKQHMSDMNPLLGGLMGKK